MDKEQVYGCMFGGALGDSLGYPVEFYTADHIKKVGMLEKPYDIRQISDDTQMTLFTAEGLIASHQKEDVLPNILSAYKYWFATQYFLPEFDYTYESELVKDRRLHSLRAPGGTCIPALRGKPEEVDNDSCGCGGVMRVAPIGLVFGAEEAYYYGCESARMTHRNILGYEPAGILAVIISEILEGKQLKTAIERAINMCVNQELKALLLEAAERAQSEGHAMADGDQEETKPFKYDWCAKSNINRGAYEGLEGQGWTGHETLAIAVYCAVKYDAYAGDKKDKFEKALIAAVFHDGDSDSTGAVLGNILGAYYGLEALPCRKTDLECSDLIDRMSEKLYEKRRLSGRSLA